jgi:hypothetical protein
LRADVATVLNAGGAQGDGDVRAHRRGRPGGFDP